MRWILKKFCYKNINETENISKFSYYVDIILLIIYIGVSLFNAIIIFIPQSIKVYLNISQMGSVPSTSVIFINIIVLLRINVKLCIKRAKNINNELTKLRESGMVVTVLNIPTWEKRKSILGIGYIVDAIIVLFNLFYGTVVINSFSWIVIISLIETFIDNFIEDAAARYEAVPEVYIKC